MKPVFLLLLCVLLWQCKPSVENTDPTPTPKNIRRIVYSGVTIDFQYTNDKLAQVTLRQDQAMQQVDFIRNTDGRLAAATISNGGRYAFDTDSEGKVLKIWSPDKSSPSNLLYELQYDALGNLATLTRPMPYFGVTQEFFYTGHNLIAYGYKTPASIPTPIEDKTVKWDQMANPVYALYKRDGFFFPILSGLSNGGFFQLGSQVLSQNNSLESAEYDTGKVTHKNEYEYRDGLPVLRRSYWLDPNNNFTEIEFIRTTYEY